MPECKFPILGATVPPMLGRDSIMNRMVAALTKPVPDHLQVVGPRFAGKTVILNELVERLRNAGRPYTAVLYWDLGHQTPATDAEFMQRLAHELAGALKMNHADYAEFLKNSQNNPYHDIAEVLDILRDEDVKVLVIMDGFDKPPSNGNLTRNLWDQLLDLGRKPSLRFVTASRRSLYDLLRSPEAQTSDFFGIFTKITVGCFDESDLSAVLAAIPEWQFEAGAKTELWNESNGFPVLTLGILNAIGEAGTTGPVSSETIRTASNLAFPELRDRLDALWGDCLLTSRDLCRRVLEDGVLARTGIASTDADMLIERGFVQSVANKLQRPSRLLRKYLDELPNEGNALVWLFGTADAYQKNLKAVLERRIEQLGGIDPTLKRYLGLGADLLPEHPSILLGNVRGIVDQAFNLIWKAEIPDKRIPSDWMVVWKRNNERRVDEWETSFPQGVHRVRLLNLMTGTDKSTPCAKHVTKGSYVLMNAVHGFGDFGQHQEGAPIDPGTAYAALHLCIELAAALTRELPDAQG